MIKFLRNFEEKLLRRLFQNEHYFLDKYLKFRNIFFSEKIFIAPITSTSTLKSTGIFFERFREETIKFNFERAHPSLKDCAIPVPSIGYYKLNSIIVNSSSHLFLYNNIWYHQEVPNDDFARWVSGAMHLIESNTSHILSYNLKQETIEKGIFIGGHFSKNWFHWVLEIISRLVLLKDSNLDLKDYVLCLPLVNDGLKNHMDILDLLNPGFRIKYLDASKFYFIREAYIADAPFFGRPNWRRNAECSKKLPYFLNPVALGEYQRIIINHSGITNSLKERRIFLGRKKQNRIYNQDEAFEFFKERGFEMVFCEDLSVKEQIELFSKVDIIVGPTGASWTNLLFCKPGCKGFCWAPDFNESFPVFAILGVGLGIDIRYGFFNVDDSDWRKWKASGSYFLSPDFLEENSKFLFEK